MTGPLRVTAVSIPSLRAQLFAAGKEIYIAGFTADKTIARVYIR